MEGGRLDPQFVAGLLAVARCGSQGRRRLDRRPAPRMGGRIGRCPGPAARKGRAIPDRASRSWKVSSAGLPQATPIQELLANRLQDAAASRAARRSSLQAMASSGLSEKQVPSAWVVSIASVLDGRPVNAALVPLAVATARALPLSRAKGEKLSGPLSRIASDSKNPDELRLSALAAVPGGLGQPDSAIFAFLLGKLARHRNGRQPHRRCGHTGTSEA